MRELQDLRSSYDLERSLAELRSAGAGIDRMLQVAIDNIRTDTASLFSPANTRSNTQYNPPVVVGSSDRQATALVDAQPLQTVRDIFRTVERPRDGIDEGLLRDSRSTAVSDRLLSLPSASLDPWAARALRQPIPHRAVEAGAGADSVRRPPPAREVVRSFAPSEAVARDAGERNTSRAILHGSDNLARQRSADRAQSSRSTGNPAVQYDDPSPILWHQGLQAHTPPRNRTRGGWRRLDENGDELECEREGMLIEPRLEQHSQSSPPRAGLGWVWRPASSASTAFDQSDESTVWFPFDRDGSRSGPTDMTRNPSRSVPAGAYRFRADREMVGR